MTNKIKPEENNCIIISVTFLIMRYQRQLTDENKIKKIEKMNVKIIKHYVAMGIKL